MEALGLALTGLGLVALIICAIWLLVKQFQTHILWGLACLFIPFVSLIWLIMYWDDGKVPFLYSLLAAVVMLIGVFMSGAGLEGLIPPIP